MNQQINKEKQRPTYSPSLSQKIRIGKAVITNNVNVTSNLNISYNFNSPQNITYLKRLKDDQDRIRENERDNMSDIWALAFYGDYFKQVTGQVNYHMHKDRKRKKKSEVQPLAQIIDPNGPYFSKMKVQHFNRKQLIKNRYFGLWGDINNLLEDKDREIRRLRWLKGLDKGVLNPGDKIPAKTDFFEIPGMEMAPRRRRGSHAQSASYLKPLDLQLETLSLDVNISELQEIDKIREENADALELGRRPKVFLDNGEMYDEVSQNEIGSSMLICRGDNQSGEDEEASRGC